MVFNTTFNNISVIQDTRYFICPNQGPCYSGGQFYGSTQEKTPDLSQVTDKLSLKQLYILALWQTILTHDTHFTLSTIIKETYISANTVLFYFSVKTITN